MSRVWLLDLLFRTSIIIFNYKIWSTITALQNTDICLEGWRKSYFFGFLIDFHTSSKAASFAYGYFIFDIIWEASHVCTCKDGENDYTELRNIERIFPPIIREMVQYTDEHISRWSLIH